MLNAHSHKGADPPLTCRARRDSLPPMRGLAPLVLVGLLLGGCGLGEAGTGLAHQRDGETYPGDRQRLTGRVEGGPACWHITLDGRSYFVIWPAGADDEIVGEEWGARLSKGEIVAPGDTVMGTGAFTPAEPLVAERYGYWAHVIGMCAPGAREVVVFDTVRRGD